MYVTNWYYYVPRVKIKHASNTLKASQLHTVHDKNGNRFEYTVFGGGGQRKISKQKCSIFEK